MAVPFGLLLSVLLVPALATEVEPKPFTFPFPVEVFDLPTAENGVDYRIFVRPPLRENSDGTPPSAFYFLDALRNFTPAASMTTNYEVFNYIPAAYFIGIGYQDETDGLPRERHRTRDYTPTAFSPSEDHFLHDHPQDWQGSGGGEAFWTAVAEEIIPFLEARYSMNPEDRVLVGKSTGGLGALHALFSQPGLFRRFVVVSPALWWDDWLLPRHERAMWRLAESTANLSLERETRVYLAAGEAEERLGMVTDVYSFAESLRRRHGPQLKVSVDILPGEQHEGVFPAAWMRGIVGVYAGEPDRKPSATAISW